jgi:ABC-type dipeptide/oligopeptide/nickel transport system permease subunit
VVRRKAGRNWRIVIGGSLVALLVIVAILAPYIVPYDPNDQDLRNTLKPPFSEGHLLGTDDLGRDMFSRILMGTRVSLAIGLATAFLAILIGVALGLVAGFFGGRTDMVLGRFFDAVLGIPSILMALGLAAVFGPSLTVIVIALGSVWWASYARIVRGEAMSLSQAQFVEAARATGCGNLRLIARYLLPNVLPIVFALASLTVASGILVEASLSFLGVGVRPPTATWGSMLSTGRNFVRTAWWMATMPGLAIVFTVLSLNILGDGLRDNSDPKLRTR